MEQNTVNQRLNFLVETFEKGKKAAFARKIGISPQGVQELLAGRKGDPSFKVLVKILESYPQVCADWLVLGNGPMLKENKGTADDKENIKSSDTLHDLRNQQMNQSADLYRWSQIRMLTGLIYSTANAELSEFKRTIYLMKQKGLISAEEAVNQCENHFASLKKSIESIVDSTENFAQKEENRVYNNISRLRRRENRVLGAPDDGTDIPDDDPITNVRLRLS